MRTSRPRSGCWICGGRSTTRRSAPASTAFAEDAICNLGVADWHGREAIRANLKAFIDTGFTALHEVKEYWDGGELKVFRGTVTMTPDNGGPIVRPTMTHFFYMDARDPTKVKRWYGAVGPVAFG